MNNRQTESLRLPHRMGGTLNAHLSYATAPTDWAVVYVHGFASNCDGEKAQVVEAACARRSWTFAGFDFRGHGQSTGSLLELSGNMLLEDLDVVRAWLATCGVRRMCLYGSSMGGWASAWYAATRPDAVIACAQAAPAFQFLRFRWDRLSEPDRKQWRDSGRLRVRNEWVDVEIGSCCLDEMDRFPVGELATKVRCPLLIFHGMLDDTVPYMHSLAFAESAQHSEIELRLYKDGDHRLLKYKEEMAEAACEFFAKKSHG